MSLLSASPLVTWSFVLSAALAVALFVRAWPPVQRGSVAAAIVGWATLQGAIAATGLYTVTETLPPRFLLAIGPALATVALLLAVPRGRAWLDALDLRALTWLHVVRVPVEWGLHRLYAEGFVPEVMTWDGRNLDILSGLSAPLAVWLAFSGPRLVRPPLLTAWNILCLTLLGIIMVHGVLSVPTPFQMFGHEQPNVALLYLPFVWLPTVIVPVVLIAHLAALRQLWRGARHGRDVGPAAPARRAPATR